MGTASEVNFGMMEVLVNYWHSDKYILTELDKRIVLILLPTQLGILHCRILAIIAHYTMHPQLLEVIHSLLSIK